MTSSTYQGHNNALAAVDPRSFHAPSFAKLTMIEMRKSVNTRAGRAILIITLGLVIVTALLTVIFSQPGPSSMVKFQEYLQYIPIAAVMLFPVIAIMTMTSEWSARAALVTFTQVPSRSRILNAKIVATVVTGLLVYVYSVVMTFVCVSVLAAKAGVGVDYANTSEALLSGAIAFILSVLFGMALGCCVSSTPLAVVIYFVLPQIINIVYGIGHGVNLKWLITLTDYIQWQRNTEMISAREFSGHVPQIITTVLVFVALPLVVGYLQTLKREVK